MNPRLARDALKQFSDGELLEELVRRKNVRKTNMPKHWCDDCAHFKAFGLGPIDLMPDNYNPCQKNHKMQFMPPEDYDFINYGFYRSVCADRDERNGDG